MRERRWLLRAALGTTLVLHGLANAVLPLRGVDASSPGVWHAWLTVLYTVAIVGFVAAGAGVLGIRPLERWPARLSIIAGICALAAHARLLHQDLWLGMVLDFGLPLITVLWFAISHGERVRPAEAARRTPRGHPAIRLAGNVIGLALVGWVAASAVLWPFTRSWGTTPTEWMLPLPGDRVPRTPSFELLHGVTIDAPPEAAWRWLVQLGQDRAWFYSYDWLERLAGADVHNVLEVRPEWQMLRTGDRIYAAPEGYLRGYLATRPGWTVAAVVPNRVLVLENWGAFVLLPTADGRTRFLIRSTMSNADIPPAAAAVNFTLFELPHFIMQRRMMLTIKALAERERLPRRIIAGGPAGTGA